ncbi:oxoglutarate dehydrogenase inhibitor [Actinocatenispora thailandica]|uniref:Oxoglutarate dehydrogenase inhibitor n=1 Tax=Actinocatenispora thailandica TaxID=227318 RepID=A0A7R7DV83_9ACTN|nr:FHA domain-containing protein [Actinocatenispora thailandica]BCJ38261.1 oxoglutarate dehydrogenase inhibitor [Actinocatenispora thailandica]
MGEGLQRRPELDDGVRPLDATTRLERTTFPSDIEASPETDRPPAGTALLVTVRGPGLGTRYPVDGPMVTIGRHPESDIRLEDVTVSRRHAQVRVAEGTYTVADLGSLNGTYVNQERIESVVLEDGDEIQIGKFRLMLRVGR